MQVYHSEFAITFVKQCSITHKDKYKQDRPLSPFIIIFKIEILQCTMGYLYRTNKSIIKTAHTTGRSSPFLCNWSEKLVYCQIHIKLSLQCAKKIIFQVRKVIHLFVVQEFCSTSVKNFWIVIIMCCFYSRLQHPEKKRIDWLVWFLNVCVDVVRQDIKKWGERTDTVSDRVTLHWNNKFTNHDG